MARDCKTCVYARPYGGENDNGCSVWTCEYINYLDAAKAFKDQPDIVRCKECRRWWGNHFHDNEDGKCPMDAWIDGDGYCSYGEREGE